MPHVADFVGLLLTQEGDRYIFGVEASPSDSNPSAFDCSELVEWGCERLGLPAPDGSWLQARWVYNAGLGMPPAAAVDTYGALLFRFSSDPFSDGRPRSAHVAVSQGNGMTIEARSTRHGVGQFSAENRGWTHAGLVPGMDYDPLEDDMGFTERQAEFLAAAADELLALEPEARGTTLAHLVTHHRRMSQRLGVPGNEAVRMADALYELAVRTDLPDSEIVRIVRDIQDTS